MIGLSIEYWGKIDEEAGILTTMLKERCNHNGDVQWNTPRGRQTHVINMLLDNYKGTGVVRDIGRYAQPNLGESMGATEPYRPENSIGGGPWSS